MSSDQLRPILFIALCFVGLLLWQAWQRDYGPKPAAVVEASPGSVPGAEPTTGPDVPAVPADAAAAEAAPGTVPVATTGEVPATDVAGAGGSVEVVTDVVRVDIALKGGTLRELDLLAYPESTEDDTPIPLFSARPSKLFLAQSGLVSAAGAPSHYSAYRAEQARYELAEGADTVEVPLVWEGEGVQVRKVYRFRRGSYVVEVDHEVRNVGSAPWRGQVYGQLRRKAPHESRGLGQIYTYTGGVISSPEKPYEKIDFSDMEDADLDREIQGGWAAMIQHYFVAAFIPPPEELARYESKAFPQQEEYLIRVVGPATTVAPGGAETLKLSLFAGPKVQDLLKDAAPGLHRTVDYGWLFFIARPLYVCLRFIHDILGNWGWSIVVLTLGIKLLFYPLSNASYKSMARMRRLQPKLVNLKERYGEDRQKMNQAMMDLYKQEKINPLGGCLPIVVQIPVFISLYWVLLETVELRQAPFMFWIEDLSIKDPYYVLPVVMGLSMFVQQRLSPSPPDPIQAKVMMFLPLIFTFFFLTFPSGLVLYWLVNNLLSILQQWSITRRMEAAG